MNSSDLGVVNYSSNCAISCPAFQILYQDVSTHVLNIFDNYCAIPLEYTTRYLMETISLDMVKH